MPIRPMLILPAVLLACGSGSVTAQPPVGSVAGGAKTVSRASIIKQEDGGRALVIAYPWIVHARASVEVRLVTGKPADPLTVHPLHFVGNIMKGQVTIDVYRTLDGAAGVPQRRRFTEGEIEFEILGRRNSLGRPAVCVARRFSNDDPPPGAAAVFYPLRPWAISRAMIQLELPAKYFSKPGRLHVWFLRNDKVLWKEEADWPAAGKKEGIMSDE